LGKKGGKIRVRGLPRAAPSGVRKVKKGGKAGENAKRPSPSSAKVPCKEAKETPGETRETSSSGEGGRKKGAF